MPQGHVDILIKEAVPIGIAKKILVEVKLGQARLRDLIQLRNYQTEFGAECIAACLIAKNFSRDLMLKHGDIKLVKYHLEVEDEKPLSFDYLLKNVVLEVIP